MTRYAIRHDTTYKYEQSMTSSQMTAFIVPRSTPTQQVESCTVWSAPVADHRYTRIDVFGNLGTYLSFESPHSRLELVAESVVETEPPVLPSDQEWEAVRTDLAHDTSVDGQLARWCRLDSRFVTTSTELADFCRRSFPAGGGVVEGIRDLTNRVFNEFIFDPSATEVSTPIDEVFQTRRGVCQDFAHLTIGCLRSIGLAARYVSGYLETEPPPGEVKLIGADASHAWCSVYLPGFGWLDADPTNNAVPPTRHITVAWARDYHDIAPVRGVTFGPPSREVLSVSVDVQRVSSDHHRSGSPSQ
jgi:transglutaminase-like putative cysteine protease